MQDAIKLEQPSGPGKFEIPKWGLVSQKKVREALIVLSSTVSESRKGFGLKEEFNPVLHLICAASTWSGNPPKDATYLNVMPLVNDGKTVYTLTVKDVPVDGLWSIIFYNAKGYF